MCRRPSSMLSPATSSPGSRSGFENRASDERHADPFQFVLKDQQGVKHAVTSAGDSWSGVKSDSRWNIRSALTRIPGDEGDHGRRTGLDA